jgi:hypothetical protein
MNVLVFSFTLGCAIHSACFSHLLVLPFLLAYYTRGRRFLLTGRMPDYNSSVPLVAMPPRVIQHCVPQLALPCRVTYEATGVKTRGLSCS